MMIFRNNDKIQFTTTLEYLLTLFLATLCTFSLGPRNVEDSAFSEEISALFDKFVIKEKHIKSLLLLKSFPDQPLDCATWIHRRLLACLESPGGLQALAMNLLSGSDDKVPLWSKCETVSKIVGARGHTKRFYSSIVNQLESLLLLAMKENDKRFIAVSISCINQLIALNREEVNKHIEKIFTEKWRLMAEPEDVLTGLCVLDEEEIKDLIQLNHIAFRGSQLSSLKTSLIQKYVPLLFQFATLLKENSEERTKLEGIVIHCMANREREELKSIIEGILFDPKDHFALHNRIGVRYNATASSFGVYIISEEESNKLSDAALEFVIMLKGSNNNILIFNVFMEILKTFEAIMSSDEEENSFDSQLIHEEDSEHFLTRTFKKKCMIVSTLAELITHKPFHFQFMENPLEILEFITNLLKRKANQLRKSDEQVLILIFSIFREFVGGQADRYVKEVQEIKSLARNLKEKCDEMGSLKSQIDFFLGEWEEKEERRDHVSKYENAKALCENAEPYLRVYGMKEMMKLIKSKDPETMANLHAILLGALVYIKDEDSYSFLASIQLLVLLTRQLEGTVIETLVVEFQDGSMSMDYRLKIGEAIVKVIQGLGIFAIKYKELFTNCFLKGIEDKSSSDEFRVSCIFNLGQICEFLSYQVHSFFNELIVTLKMVLEHDPYLPSRRSAALLLSNLLSGMNNLIDFQECLLPVYRLLKYICNNDEDEKTRIHANTGLTILHDKIKEALKPREGMQKEIKILGVELERDRIKCLFPK